MKSFTVSSDGDISPETVLLEGVRHAVLAQGGKQVDGRQVGQGRDYRFGGGASLVDVPSSRVVL